MDKKVLKWYESPVMETVELEIEGFLCASGGVDGLDNPDDITGGNDDPGF